MEIFELIGMIIAFGSVTAISIVAIIFRSPMRKVQAEVYKAERIKKIEQDTLKNKNKTLEMILDKLDQQNNDLKRIEEDMDFFKKLNEDKLNE